MKKYIIGAIISASLMISITAYAENKSTFSYIDKIDVGYSNLATVQKIYDQDSNVICYTITGGPSGAGISCMKNN